jgi:cyanase
MKPVCIPEFGEYSAENPGLTPMFETMPSSRAVSSSVASSLVPDGALKLITKSEAENAGKLLGLSEAETIILTEPPNRGSLTTLAPTDHLIHELVQTYGTTWKALIEEEFGDGIMSAIDFEMQIEREPNPKGDRVRVSMSGKFLPYKRY